MNFPPGAWASLGRPVPSCSATPAVARLGDDRAWKRYYSGIEETLVLGLRGKTASWRRERTRVVGLDESSLDGGEGVELLVCAGLMLVRRWWQAVQAKGIVSEPSSDLVADLGICPGISVLATSSVS